MDFILWLQSFRSPLFDTLFAIINSTAKDNFIDTLCPKFVQNAAEIVEQIIAARKEEERAG